MAGPLAGPLAVPLAGPVAVAVAVAVGLSVLMSSQTPRSSSVVLAADVVVYYGRIISRFAFFLCLYFFPHDSLIFSER